VSTTPRIVEFCDSCSQRLRCACSARATRSAACTRRCFNAALSLIVLEIGFIEGRPKEKRLALLKDINARVAAAARVSPDDMMIMLYEVPGENVSFGQGEAQRANVVARS
jgi:hypothetical protein